MFKQLAISMALSASLITSGMSFASNDIDASQLKAVITAKIAATTKESESIEDMMKTMHSGSPIALEVRTQMEQLFPIMDANTSLTEFSFIGKSEEYAIAKIKERVEKVNGPAQFKSLESEQLIVFKQEEGQWKIWQASILDMTYL